MERNNNTCAILLSWICRISMLLLTVSSPEPRIIGCELLEHANITCYWTAPSSENISYMMQVTTYNCMNKIISTDSCNTTSTKCTVKIGSVSHCFCVDVLMLTSSLSTSLPTHCFNGINQVKMYTPQITALTTLPENATCLKLEWKEPRSEYVHSERNLRVLQIEYHTPQQAHVSKVTAFLHDWWTNMCGLYPGTKHLVRVRAQDLRAQHHWSSWSEFAEATTAETAPVAAPELWRHIQQVDRSGKRRVTLLWKPLQWPNSNGVILRYAASCRNELDSSYWDCGHLDSYSTSCVLSVTAHACNCNLTASNSAGTSPSAHIYIPGDKDAELRPPESISVNALDDFQLKVEWKALVNQSESSYVVEWFPIPETSAVGLHWKILNGFETSFIITEGVQPEVPYNVSVRVLRKNTAGIARFAVAFTRQGAPSAGPKLEVLQTSTDVTLKWKPVPLEKLRGFIQNYTVIYKYNGKVKSEVLSGNTKQFSLNGLSPGQYAVCVKAHTLTGGAESSWVTVTVGRVHIPVMAIVLCAVGSLLVVIILLSQAERIQQCLCPVVPDPSKSSLSTWLPVSPNQHKLPTWDSPALFDPIYMGGVQTGHHVPHHLLDSKLQAFSQQTSQEQVCKQVLLASEQTFNEPNAQDLNEELTTDLSYQNAFMETSHCCHSGSSSCPEVPKLGKSPVDSIFYESSIEPRLDSSYEKFESAFATRVFCDCAPMSKSCLRVDTLDQDDPFYRRSTVSNLKTHCYRHVSTSYLPVSDSYIDFRTAMENSTNLIHESSHFSRLESSCYSHVSASYLPIPEPSPAYADYVTVNSAAELFHQSSHMPKKGARGYVHVSTSYLPIPLTSHSDSTFTNSIHENNSVSGLKSCIYNHLQINYQKSCPDFEVEEVYKPFVLKS